MPGKPPKAPLSLWAALVAVLLTGVSAGADPPVPSIVTYRKEIGLTDPQVVSIQKAVEDFRKQAQGLNAKLEATLAQVNADLTAHADLPVVKAHLKAWYEARFELHYADLASGRRLESLLTKEQLERWRALQAEARKKNSKPQ